MPLRSTTALGLLFALLPAAPAWAALELIPQFDLLLVNFAVLMILIYPVNRFVLQPLVEVLTEREARTAGAIDQAERLLAEAAEGRASLEERIDAVRAEAQSRRGAILAEGDSQERRLLDEARDEANREIGSVRTAIAGEIESARDALGGEAQALAREAAARILGRELR